MGKEVKENDKRARAGTGHGVSKMNAMIKLCNVGSSRFKTLVRIAKPDVDNNDTRGYLTA